MATPSAGRIIWIGVLLGIGFLIPQHLPQLFAEVLDTSFLISVMLVDALSSPRFWRELVKGVLYGFAFIAICGWCLERIQAFYNWRRARHVAAMRKHFVEEMEISLKQDE
jgi:hypothetical protein